MFSIFIAINGAQVLAFLDFIAYLDVDLYHQTRHRAKQQLDVSGAAFRAFRTLRVSPDGGCAHALSYPRPTRPRTRTPLEIWSDLEHQWRVIDGHFCSWSPGVQSPATGRCAVVKVTVAPLGVRRISTTSRVALHRNMPAVPTCVRVIPYAPDIARPRISGRPRWQWLLWRPQWADARSASARSTRQTHSRILLFDKAVVILAFSTKIG